jgi:hypothetical protein
MNVGSCRWRNLTMQQAANDRSPPFAMAVAYGPYLQNVCGAASVDEDSVLPFSALQQVGHCQSIKPSLTAHYCRPPDLPSLRCSLPKSAIGRCRSIRDNEILSCPFKKWSTYR